MARFRERETQDKISKDNEFWKVVQSTSNRMTSSLK